MKKQKNTIKSKYRPLFNVIVAALIIGFITGLAVSNKDIQHFFEDDPVPPTQSDPILIGSSEIELCFTPPAGCGQIIANLISNSNTSIYVQAYGITSKIIVDALITAHNKGVKVRILLDKSNLQSKYSKMPDLKEAGIDVSIDRIAAIAHNKVMILDEQKVITGSFNFTESADNRNAENVIIVNDQQVAKRYLQNWLSRKSRNDLLEQSHNIQSRVTQNAQ